MSSSSSSSSVWRLLSSRVARGAAGAVAGLSVVAGLAAVAPPAHAAPVSRHIGWGSYSFTHFSVRVGDVVADPAHGTLVYTVVCVRSLPAGSVGGRTRISWDPWRITTTKGSYAPKVYDASHPPARMFPKSRNYGVGQCAAGWIPYATAKGAVTKISYANSLGNSAAWSTPPQTANTSLGVTRSFARFTLRVHQTAVDPDGYWAGARATVCVVSDAGYPAGVPVDQTPWTLSTDRGVFTTMIMQEGAPQFGTEFPWSTKLHAGQCVTGWIGFALIGYGEGIQLRQVSYRNSLGNAASWHA